MRERGNKQRPNGVREDQEHRWSCTRKKDVLPKEEEENEEEEKVEKGRWVGR